MRIAPAITLSSDQRAVLEQWARSRSLPARVVERARIVLLAAERQQGKQIAAALKITPKKVSRWRHRFRTLGGGGGTRCLPARSNAQDHPPCGAARGAHDNAAETAERQPLEYTQQVASRGYKRGQRASHVVQSWFEAASRRKFQDQQRP
jgi:hypothetical protein